MASRPPDAAIGPEPPFDRPLQVLNALQRAQAAVTFKCPPCDGDGYTERWLEDDEGRDFPVAIPCERCGGTGELRDDGEDDPE